MIRSQYGFSLIELMISLAISSFIVLVSFSINVQNLSIAQRFQAKSSLIQDVLMLGDYFSIEIQHLGGGAIRPWSAVRVENDCIARAPLPGCNDSDRVTVVLVPGDSGNCAVGPTPAPGVLQILLDAGGICCVTSANFMTETATYKRQVMVTRGTEFRNYYIASADPATCQITVQPGQANRAGLDDAPAPEGPPLSDINWAGAAMNKVEIKTFYADMVTNELRVFQDDNNNNTIEPGREDRVIANNIFDFQISLGYDVSPADGVAANGVILNTGDQMDEWLHNNAADGVGLGIAGTGLARANLQDLRMVSVGVILGAQTSAGVGVAGTAQVLDGPTRTRNEWTLEAHEIRIMPRNSAVYQ